MTRQKKRLRRQNQCDGAPQDIALKSALARMPAPPAPGTRIQTWSPSSRTAFCLRQSPADSSPPSRYFSFADCDPRLARHFSDESAPHRSEHRSARATGPEIKHPSFLLNGIAVLGTLPWTAVYHTARLASNPSTNRGFHTPRSARPRLPGTRNEKIDESYFEYRVQVGRYHRTRPRQVILGYGIKIDAIKRLNSPGRLWGVRRHQIPIEHAGWRNAAFDPSTISAAFRFAWSQSRRRSSLASGESARFPAGFRIRRSSRPGFQLSNGSTPNSRLDPGESFQAEIEPEPSEESL